jgi:alpha-beta hydrolase superfamily lysophospholipase
VEAAFYDPLAHELFNEPEREEVLARLEQWLELTAASRPSVR